MFPTSLFFKILLRNFSGVWELDERILVLLSQDFQK